MVFGRELTTKKALNVASMKTMVAGAEAGKRNVQVTICMWTRVGTCCFC